jgi:histidinol-phosphate phosphatase family protein
MGLSTVIAAGERGAALLPVAGRPLLEHQLAWLKAWGRSEVEVRLGPGDEAAAARFGDGSRLGVRLRFVPEKAPGAAGTVRDPGTGVETLVVEASCFPDLDLRRFLDFHAGHRGAATAVAAAADPSYAGVWAARPGLAAALARGEAPALYRTGEAAADLRSPGRRAAFEALWKESGRDAAAYGRRWAVFLDRDGVLNEERGQISRAEDIALLPGAAAAVKRLKDAGALVVVATNQSAVARGWVDEDGLGVIHARLKSLLAAGGGVLDGIEYCPHHPDAGEAATADPRYRRDCECRKPKPGLLTAAARRWGADLSRSYFVGDSTRDIQAARAAGVAGVLVRTGHGGKDGLHEVEPDAVADDLTGAADWILAREKARPGKKP